MKADNDIKTDIELAIKFQQLSDFVDGALSRAIVLNGEASEKMERLQSLNNGLELLARRQQELDEVRQRVKEEIAQISEEAAAQSIAANQTVLNKFSNELQRELKTALEQTTLEAKVEIEKIHKVIPEQVAYIRKVSFRQSLLSTIACAVLILSLIISAQEPRVVMFVIALLCILGVIVVTLRSSSKS